ncbi:fibroblast growth factor receptor 3-like [Glandiceps talaboti]
MQLMKISIIVAMAISMVKADNSTDSATSSDFSDSYDDEYSDNSESNGSMEVGDSVIDPDFHQGEPPSDSEPMAPKWNDFEKLKNDRLLVRPSNTEVMFRCRASGNPTPNVTWYKDGELLTEKRRIGTKPRFKPSKVILRDALTSDNGNYTCVVQNEYGSINYTFKLEIVRQNNDPPLLVADVLKNQTVPIGTNVTFRCAPLIARQRGASLSYHMQWFKMLGNDPKDLETLETNWPKHQPHDWTCSKMVNETFDEPSFICLNKTEVIGNKNEIVLENVTQEDSGRYLCWASNVLGLDYKSAWLKVLPDNYVSTTTLSETTSPPKQEEESKELYIILALIVLVVLIIVGFVLFLIRRRRKKPAIRGRIIAANPSMIQHQMSMESNSSVGSSHPLIRRNQRLSSNITSISEIEIPYDESWEFPRNRLTIGKPLGEGAFGQVLEAVAVGIGKNGSNNSSITVAVKMLKSDATEKELNDLISEMDIMKQMGKHINIINILGCCTQEGPLLVIVEYAPHGNLRDFLRSRRPQNMDYENAALLPKIELLTNKDLVSFAYQIARGMEFLALKKCVHRDLAARNVLVGENFVMKIADFGLARDVHYIDYYRKNTNGRVPVKWMSPEALFDRVYTTQSDVWSFGVLLWEIMTLGGSPYPSLPVEMLFDFLKSGKRMEQPLGCSPEIFTIMRDCWKTSPNQRPSFQRLVEMLDNLLTKSMNQDYLSLDALGDGPEVLAELLADSSGTTNTSSKHRYVQEQEGHQRLESTV